MFTSNCGDHKTNIIRRPLISNADQLSCTSDPRDFNQTVKPLVDQHCVNCHNSSNSSGGFDFDRKGDIHLWLAAEKAVLSGSMPLHSKLDQCSQTAITAYLDTCDLRDQNNLWSNKLLPFAETNCNSCHQGEKASAGVDLTNPKYAIQSWQQAIIAMNKGHNPIGNKFSKCDIAAIEHFLEEGNGTNLDHNNQACTNLPLDIFHERILPAAERACTNCHNDNNQKAGLSFTDHQNYETWNKGLDAIVKGTMPPAGPGFSQCEIDSLKDFLGIECLEVKDDELWEKRVRPAAERLCISCHNSQKAEANIVLDRIGSLGTWQAAHRSILSGRMPPSGHTFSQCEVKALEKFSGITNKNTCEGITLDNLSFDQSIKPILNKYCTNCHNDKRGSIRLDIFIDPDDNRSTLERWSASMEAIKSGSMPPNSPSPFLACEKEILTKWFNELKKEGIEADPDFSPVLRQILLNREELKNTILDIFGSKALDQVMSSINLYSVESGNSNIHPFIGNSIPISDPNLIALNQVAQNIGTYIRANPDYWKTLFTCSDMKNKKACFRDFTAHLGLFLNRRPLNDSRLQQLIDTFYREDAPIHESISLLIDYLLQSPNFAYKIERQNEPLDQYEIASRLSFAIFRSSPSIELYRLAHRGELTSPQIFKDTVNFMFANDKSKRWLYDFFTKLIIDTRITNISAPDFFTKDLQKQTLYQDALKEFERFINLVLYNGRGSIKDFLTSTVADINSTNMAKIYKTGGALGPQNVRDRPGVLTRSSFLIDTGIYAKPIRRAKRIRTNLLCETLQPSAIQDDEKEQGTRLDPSKNPFRDFWEQLTSPGNCQGCHAKLNPVGLTFQEFDTFGRWYPQEHRWDDEGQISASFPYNRNFTPRVYLYESDQTNSVQEFVTFIGSHEATSKCINRQLFRYLFNEDTKLSHQYMMNQFLDGQDKTSDSSIIDLYKDLILRPEFLQPLGE